MRIYFRSLLIYTFIQLAFSLYLPAQSWNFVKERDSISIYTRTERGSPLKSFKGVMEVYSTMDKIATIIGNVKNFDWWDDDIRVIRVLDAVDNEFYQYYLIYDVPWPLMDRDLCVDARVSIDTSTGKKVIHAIPLPNIIPEEQNMIRIKNYWQTWTIEPLKNGLIRLTLEGFVDPGGIVPSWLYNMVITDTPLNLMREVKIRVEIKPPVIPENSD